MPTYRIDIDGLDKPRVVDAKTPQGARAHVAKGFRVEKIAAREAFTLARDGVELEIVGDES